MTQPIQADFVDYKNVKTRSKMQLIFEVDTTQAKHVLDSLGYPDNSVSMPCGIVRLNPHAIAEPVKLEKPKSFAGQAKMMAGEYDFAKYLKYNHTYEQWNNLPSAEEYIETYCGVSSCSELIEGTEAGSKFKKLQAEFLQWKDN